MNPANTRNRYLLVADAVGIVAAIAASYLLRFEGLDWGAHRPGSWVFLATSLPVTIAIFWAFGLYRRLWRYASITEVRRIVAAVFTNGLVILVLGALLLPITGSVAVRVPISVLIMAAILTGVMITAPRLLIRLIGGKGLKRRRRDDPRALIVGAGVAGVAIAKQLTEHTDLGLNPVGFVDDDLGKQKQRIFNLPVHGTLSDIPALVAAHDISELIIAMPTAPGGVIRRVVHSATELGVRTRTVPGLSDMLSGAPLTALRPVQITDLLRRAPIETDLSQIRSLAARQVMLVTGAGGSIGSELVRQLARLDPAEIILLGHGENSIFDILGEVTDRFPTVRFTPVIADIRHRERMQEVFERHRPAAVFHAAAHKHVPLMERNIADAVTNNVLGTRNVAELAAEFGVDHLVMISTDKAVRPTSIMGATKRVAELVLHHVAAANRKNFVAVRFGNVLGSRGSVVPAFLRQIKQGGPVTVTHPEMRRYFMTIPEAVQLVIQAGAIGEGGEVFVLDMGNPVKIVDLATDLIRLSGLEVGKDIEIRFSGMRPGEKLYEELFFNPESATPTAHPKILRAKVEAVPAEGVALAAELVDRALAEAPDEELRHLLTRLVPDLRPEVAVEQIG
ncbi:MAG: nucleoside-diphosphate sugar epimerase/dehydratase [Gemmatimonadales bacterium]|nr:nucleoside-diphosphate sugar epimerase/dehydratase [Gemmatimonadales bacterium]